MKKESKTKLIILVTTVVVLVAVCVLAAVFKGLDFNGKTTAGGQDNPAGSQTGITNIDGTPIEVEPYVDSEGKPVVNEDGYQVYQVKNTVDANGEPILVIKNAGSAENEFSYIVQTNDGDVIKDKTDENGVPQTTAFKGDPSKIPTASVNQNAPTGGNNQAQTEQQGTASSNGQQDTTAEITQSNRDLPDTIDLGGVFGTVTKDESKGKNIYKGYFNENELENLKAPVTYENIGATFTKGVYIPSRIGDYNVVQIAYVRLYTYYDQAFKEYDWYSERGIFKPGNDNDPIVYLGKNDTFDIDDDVANIHSLFLIELS